MTDAKLRQVKEKVKQINALSRSLINILSMEKEVNKFIPTFTEDETVRLKDSNGKWSIVEIQQKVVTVKDLDGNYLRDTTLNNLKKIK